MSELAIRMAGLNELAEEPEFQLRGSSVPVGAASCMLHVIAGAGRASQTLGVVPPMAWESVRILRASGEASDSRGWVCVPQQVMALRVTTTGNVLLRDTGTHGPEKIDTTASVAVKRKFGDTTCVSAVMHFCFSSFLHGRGRAGPAHCVLLNTERMTSADAT